MRILRILIVGLLLAAPGLAMADIGDVPGDTTWYLHVDFEGMKSESAGKGVYGWLVDEVFHDVKENEFDEKRQSKYFRRGIIWDRNPISDIYS